MEKQEENQDGKKKEDQKEEKEIVKPVMLGQMPTEYGLVYRTPDGVFSEKEYLVWLGNLIVEIKEGLVG